MALNMTHSLQFSINPWQILSNKKIMTLLGRSMAQINTLGDGDGVIKDYFRNFHLSSVISLEELIFLFLYVMSMLENIATMLKNIAIALGGLMTSMGKFLMVLG